MAENGRQPPLPPLPPQPPTAAAPAAPGPAEPGRAQEVCRKFIWGTCNKTNNTCRFRHEHNFEEMVTILKFCHNYQNKGGCALYRCSYLHTTRQEESLFKTEGIVPRILQERYAAMSAAPGSLAGYKYPDAKLMPPPPPPPVTVALPLPPVAAAPTLPPPVAAAPTLPPPAAAAPPLPPACVAPLPVPPPVITPAQTSNSGNDGGAAMGCADLARELAQLGITYFSLNINSLHQVVICHVEDPSNFYVRLTAYTKYMDILEEPGSSLQISDVQLQTQVVFFSAVENKPIRGNILNLDMAASTAQINAVDYGFMETVHINKIYRPRQNYNVPPLAICCELHFCDPRNGKWDSEAIGAMKEYIYFSEAKIVIRGKSNGKYVVDVHNDGLETVSLMLVQLDLATFGVTSSSSNQRSIVPKVEKEFFTFNNYRQDDILVVRTVSGKSLDQFYVAELDAYQKYLTERTNVTHFYRQSLNLTEEELKAGIPVCVYDMFYDRYDRCIVKEIIEREKALVQSIDTGIVREAHLSNMKRVNQKLYNNPATAIHCSAVDMQRYHFNSAKILHPGQKLKIKITEIGEKLVKPYIVKILEIGGQKV